MADAITRDLDVQSAVAQGAAIDVRDLDGMTIYFTGFGVGTVQVEIATDSAGPWFSEGAAVSADGILEITKTVLFVRANTTAYTSGTLAGTIVAHRAPQAG